MYVGGPLNRLLYHCLCYATKYLQLQLPLVVVDYLPGAHAQAVPVHCLLAKCSWVEVFSDLASLGCVNYPR